MTLGAGKMLGNFVSEDTIGIGTIFLSRVYIS